ncbi:hypothetical protein FACS189459_5190 [Bacilli bacterium]|nr:hypothetical protein FACS189459_5190 [Bacilli bacterium]
MPTKGRSNLYGNTKGAPTEHINFPYAKEFNAQTLARHYDDHKKSVNSSDPNDYAKKSINFANEISFFNDSFIDIRGSTYKFNPITKEFAIINSSGKIITYYKIKDKY